MRARPLVFNKTSAASKNILDKSVVAEMYLGIWELISALDELDFIEGPLIHGEDLIRHSMSVNDANGNPQEYSALDWLAEIKRADNVVSSVVTNWLYRNCEPRDETKQKADDFIYSRVNSAGIEIDIQCAGIALEEDGLLISLASSPEWNTGVLDIMKTDVEGARTTLKLTHASHIAHLKEAYPLQKNILILTEDKKSSVFYLQALYEQEFKIPKNRVEIRGLGVQTLKVVEEALALAQSASHEYHQILCVFDHDDEAHFGEALVKAESSKFRNSDGMPLILAIPTNPCYEFWLLLHFKNHRSSASAGALPNQSVGEQMRQKLLSALPSYGKNDENILSEIKKSNGSWRTAVLAAKQINKEQGNNYNNRPTTAFPSVITALRQFSLRC